MRSPTGMPFTGDHNRVRTMRLLIASSVFLFLASAFALYAVNYETRSLSQSLSDKERALKKAREDIAVLKAERAHLARPERISNEARRLGLRPAQHSQFVPYNDPDPLGLDLSRPDQPAGSIVIRR